MSTRPRRRNLGEGEPEHDTSERWMASYMDMVTVIMCMFIVLYSMSVVDKDKFQELKNSLATGFGTTKTEKIDSAQGVVLPKDLLNKDAQGFTKVEQKAMTDRELAEQELDSLAALEQKIHDALAAQQLASSVDLKLDERGLTIRLIGSETFFATNKIDLSNKAVRVLDAVAPPLRETPYSISVEGHADARSAAYPYPTNWELSSGRATQVLRHLVEQDAIVPTRISAVGFGDTRPLSTGTTPADLAKNRRVDIVVLSTQPEEVRALIPGILQERQAAATAGVASSGP
ncbi:flagellar motor protein MotB [Microbacterium sp. STN6]|uniref:OmpA/MotB family protein n=1 Tax=Microbacterium sp. STN6 TaxID=2995588 RepID=UPI002260E234|nr:flagellar motor protein MotB [Microbacterium sp. STN6]MCX7522390.1 flagellar motor protein MotB [Microbacterium sp. STN6]